MRENGMLDRYATEMRQSWQDDFDLWVKDTPRGPYAASFDEEVERMRTWLSERRDWINKNIDQELTRVMCKITFEADGKAVGTEYVRIDGTLESIPAWPQKDGKVFLGWTTQDGTVIDRSTFFDESTTATAQYADIADVSLTTITARKLRSRQMELRAPLKTESNAPTRAPLPTMTTCKSFSRC